MIIPYIGIKLKAISDTFHQITLSENSDNVFYRYCNVCGDSYLYFSSYYGTRYAPDASEKRLGIISAAAVESFLKLIFCCSWAICNMAFVVLKTSYQQAQKFEDFAAKNTFNGLEGSN